MSTEAKTLYHYQATLFHRLRTAISEGHRDLLLHAPPAAGKTLTTQALIAHELDEGRFQLAVVLAPLETIRSRWTDEQVVAAPGGKLHTYKARPMREREAKTLAFWKRSKRAPAEVVTACRSDVCSRAVLDLLAAERPDLSRVLVIGDEGHHHASTNLSGRVLDFMRELGATVLRSTGTPWHAQGQVKSADTVSVSLSLAAYARERDPATGRPYAPQVWIAQQEQVDFRTEDEKLAIDSGKDRERIEPTEYRDRTLARMVAHWLANGCPKTVMNVPRVEWAKLLIELIGKAGRKAKAHLGHAPRVLDMAGDDCDAEANAVLAREAKVTRFADSAVDVVVSCARMNEGTDWPLCTDVYNVGVPGTLTLLIQRWCRASRSKLKIKGYPRTPVLAGDGRKVELRDVQRMTFFVPLLSCDARDRLWKVHHEHALLAACMLEDYEVGLQWAASVARPAEFGQALVEKRPPGMERDQWIAVLEAERAEAIEGDQRDRAEALSLLVRRMAKEPAAVPYGRLAELAAQVGKGKGEDIAAALQSVTMGVLSRVAGERREEIDRRLEDAAARVSKAGSEALPGRLKSAVRAEMRAQFEAIAAEFADVMVAIPPSTLRNAAVFTGYMPQEVADKLGTFTGGYIRDPVARQAEILAYRNEHGELPRGGRLGRMLNYLRSRFPEWCRANGIPSGVRRADDMAEMVLRYKREHGRWPTVEWSRSALGQLRAKHPDVCRAFGIPLMADGEQIRDSIRAGRGWEMFSMSDLISALMTAWRASQLTAKVGRFSGRTLDDALRRYPKRLIDGDNCMQLTSVSRANDEIAADCWRLWLDGADQPDPRPWADILAAGDNKRVVKAERVAFLDWTDLDKNGKPKRKPWKPPVDRTPPHDAATPAKTSRPKAGNRAPKAQKTREKTCTKT